MKFSNYAAIGGCLFALAVPATAQDDLLQDLLEEAKKEGGGLDLSKEELEEMAEQLKSEQELDAEPEKEGGSKENSRPSRNGPNADGWKYSKLSQANIERYRPVIADARKATVKLLDGEKELALGTVVRRDGYILTKLSEVENAKALKCQLAEDSIVEATIADTYGTFDLALLKVEKDDLHAVTWGEESPSPGSFLAAPGRGKDPISIGALSVAPRDLYEKDTGFLGVGIQTVNGDVVISRIVKNASASRAGIKTGDIVKTINGNSVSLDPADFDAEIDDPQTGEKRRKTLTDVFIEMIRAFEPGDSVDLTLQRKGEELKIVAILGSRLRGNPTMAPNDQTIRMMGHRLSSQRNGYPSVLQHDLVLQPEECGGPLVDLTGDCIGLNIARSGRISTFAIPAAEITRILGDIPKGKFAVADTTSLEATVKETTRKIQSLERQIDALHAKHKKAAKRLEEVQQNRDASETSEADAQKNDSESDSPEAPKEDSQRNGTESDSPQVD